MLICSTHTHSGPSSNTKDGPAPAVAYRKRLVDGIAHSLTQAHAALEPAAVAAASHPLPDEVFNRRWFLKAGKMPLNPFGRLDLVKMNPGTSPDVLDRPAGPTDPELSILSVQDSKRRPLALVANYALHYVGGRAARPDLGRLLRRVRTADAFAPERQRGPGGNDGQRCFRGHQ
jgi:hypothetical protein